ncbi:MAG: MaoC/PaaZ C-terminal domain-containing protein [Pirellulaceae bacterium]|nr:MaoC/PaaZ C-terminal domain-containing protein [Pirellulaceae bacterium]
MSDELLSFEDLQVGDNWTSSSREITSGEIRDFADLTGDFTRIHLDREYAAETPFGAPIAHGLLGLSVLAGLSSVAPTVRTTALVDIRNWQFRKPIYVGDQIHAVTEVTELRDRGRRHGEVHWYRKLINQRGEIVQDGMLTTLVERNVLLSSKNKKDKSLRIDAAGPSVPRPSPENPALDKTSAPNQQID